MHRNHHDLHDASHANAKHHHVEAQHQGRGRDRHEVKTAEPNHHEASANDWVLVVIRPSGNHLAGVDRGGEHARHHGQKVETRSGRRDVLDNLQEHWNEGHCAEHGETNGEAEERNHPKRGIGEQSHRQDWLNCPALSSDKSNRAHETNDQEHPFNR